jgi:hypothetical protein
VVFCVFNWHDELLRAQMDDDWTANIVCVLFACYLSLGSDYQKPKQNQKQQQSTQAAKKRDFSILRSYFVELVEPAKRTRFGITGSPLSESQKSRFVVQKQNRTKQNNTKTHKTREI